jgi:4-amino-4-deoxy-L-arabinose transferase-like glycosyltransferase
MTRVRRTLAVAAVFLGVSYLALRDTSVLTPQQGHQHICTAASLVKGRGFEVIAGVPMASNAPLYSMLLAPFALVGHAVVPAVYLLNCLALTAGLLGFYWLAREADLPGAGAATTAFALWAVHYYLLRMARPDGLAIALTLLTLATLLRYGRLQRIADLVPVAAFATLAALCRYMTALTLLPVVAVGVTVLTAGPARRRWLRGGTVAVLTGLPIAAWVGRNLALTGHLFGMSRTAPRSMAAGSDLSTNVTRLGETLGVDLFATDALATVQVIEGSLTPSHRYWIVAAAVIAFGATVFAAIRCPRDCFAAFVRRRAVVGLLLYPAFYLVMLLMLWTLGNNDPIHTRYVAPLYPFLALAGLALASQLASDRLALGALALAGVLALVPSCVKSVGLLSERPDNKLLEVLGHNLDLWNANLVWESPECRRLLPRAKRRAN